VEQHDAPASVSRPPEAGVAANGRGTFSGHLTMRTFALVTFATAVLFSNPCHLEAQQRERRAATSGDGAKVAPAGKAGAVGQATASTSNPLVSVATLALQRDAVQSVSTQLAASRGSKSRGFAASLKKTFTGDKVEIDAARRVLGQMAQSLDEDQKTTVIVVIGSAEDRDKVVQSLAEVQRKVTVAFVDKDSSDTVNDNTVLGGGMAGAVTDGATNVWVYLPHHGGSPKAKPHQMLASRAAAPAIWNGVFAADGDAVDLGSMKSLVSHGSNGEVTAVATSPTPAPAAGGTAAAPGPIVVGDVVKPRIANVKVLADASADAKVLGTVTKTDELVVTGAVRNGFLSVEGATLKGWVSAALVAKE
jgi:hypothetical protein